MHDTLHHLSATTVGSWFDDNPTLQHLVATAVIPPETSFNLPCLNNELYRFSVDAGTLTYVPEGHNGGNYTQPLSARDWLSSDRLVTPTGECLHIALLETTHAHHLLLVTRVQLVKEKRRTLDMPELTTIPFLAHPFGTPFSRLTTPSILAAQVNYSVRVSATNMRDQYAKVAASQAETYGRYPLSFVRAATLYALRLRALDYHANGSLISYALAWVGELFRFPLLPVSWLLQSLSSRRFSGQLDTPMIWTVPCGHMVAQRADSRLPGLVGHVCDATAVPLFYLPPHADALARATNFLSRFFVFVGVKVIFFPLTQLVLHNLHYVPGLFDFITDKFDMDWKHTPVGLLFLLIGLWYGVSGPSVPWPPFVAPAFWFLRNVYALYWGLVSHRAVRRHGRSWTTLVLATLTPVLHTWPKLDPAFYWFRKSGAPPVAHHFVVGFAAVSWVVSLFMTRGRHRYELPWHGVPPLPPLRDVEEGLVPEPTETDPDSVPDDLPLPPPFLEREARFVEDTIELGSYSPSPASVTLESRTPTPLLPQRGTDPYWQWAVLPSSFPDHAAWRRIAFNLPTPPNVLNPQNSCVWDCIAASYGLDSHVVHAMYLAAMSPAERLNWFDGLVPYERLPDVLHFFGLGYTIHSASRAGEACPRIPGADAAPVYDQTKPPAFTAQAAPFGLSVTYFIAPADDGSFHLTTHANNEKGAGGVLPAANAMIGFISRQLSALELGSIINAPVGSFLQSWSRLNGTSVSAPAVMANLPHAALPQFVSLPRLAVSEQVRDYTLSPADVDAAVSLARDLKDYPAEMDIREFPALSIARGLYEQVKMVKRQSNGGVPPPAVKLHLFHGAPGTGKTFQLMQSLAARHRVQPFTSANLRFHTWLNCLRSPLEASAMATLPGLMSHNFQTGCMPFAQPLPGTIVLDDATQLWPGFIPLLIATNPQLTDIYMTFDVTQGRSAFPVADSASRKELSTAEWLAPLSDYYATESWRLSMENSQLFGMPVPNATLGHRVTRGVVALVSNVVNDLPLLVVSPRFATSQNEGGQRCMTFRECQGFTIDGDVTIDLGGLSATATDNACWTAITRARGNIMFYLGPLSKPKGLNESLFGRSSIMSAILAVMAQNGSGSLTPADDPAQLVARAVQAHMSRCLSPAACRRLGLSPRSVTIGQYGVSAPFRSDWLATARPDFAGDFYTARTHRAVKSGIRSAPGPAFDRDSRRVAPVETRPAPHLLRHVVAIHNDHVLHADPSDYSIPAPPNLTAVPDPALNFDRPVDPEKREFTAPNFNQTHQHVLWAERRAQALAGGSDDCRYLCP